MPDPKEDIYEEPPDEVVKGVHATGKMEKLPEYYAGEVLPAEQKGDISALKSWIERVKWADMTEMDLRLADTRKLWSIDRDKSLAALFKIKQLAQKKGNYGVAAKCEELRAKLGGLFIERIQTMNINQELSKDDIDNRLLKIFPDKKSFLEG